MARMASSLSTEQLAPLEVRRDEEIFATDGGWFRARWHFSFDKYNDPANMGMGTLRVFNHDTLAPGAVWPMHPHRDVEGITYVVTGHFEHADSIGGGGILEAGGVQRMTLGSGAEHSERNHSQTEEMQFLQLWILPGRRGLKPEVAQRQHSMCRRTTSKISLAPQNSGAQSIADWSGSRARASAYRSRQVERPGTLM